MHSCRLVSSWSLVLAMRVASLVATLVNSDLTSKQTSVSMGRMVMSLMVSMKWLEFLMWCLVWPTRGRSMPVR